MRHRVLVALLALASLLLTLSPRISADARGPSYLQAAASTPALSAKIWEGRNAEFEEYIRTAEIDHFDDISLGVTHPKRAYFKPGGLVASVAWKVLPPGRPV